MRNRIWLTVAASSVIAFSSRSIPEFKRSQDDFKITAIPTLGGDTNDAWGMNSASWVVGESVTASGTNCGYVWDGRRNLVLESPSTLDPGSEKVTYGTSIDDHGRV